MARLFQIEAPCLAAPVRGRRGAGHRVRAHFRGLSLAGHANRNPLTQAGDGPQKSADISHEARRWRRRVA
jgi:hypothetical protein